MADEKVDNDKISESSSKLTNEYLQKASYLGTILPLLDIGYETIIEPKIKKYNLNIVKEFWIYFGLLIFSSLYLIYDLKIEVVIFFAFATLFTLIVYNFDFFKKRILPDEADEIQRFINKIDEKALYEVIDFIKDYRKKLKENDIRLIINSRHGNNWTIYKFFLDYQYQYSKILVEIVEKNKFEIIGEDLFDKYLKQFRNGIPFESYKLLVDYFKDNRKVLKTINMLNPSYLKSKSKFKTVTISIQSFYISLTQGRISEVIRFVILALVIAVAVIGFKQITDPYIILEPFQSFPILLLINYFFAVFLTAGIIVFFVMLCLTALTKFLWSISGLFAPDKPDYILETK